MNYNKIAIVRDFEKVRRLFEIVSKDSLGYIAGGFPRWCSSPKTEPSEYRDVDVFSTGEESYQKLVKIFTYQEKLKVKHENDISITFKTKGNEVWKDCPMINLIKPISKGKLLTFANNLEDILNNFDFSICRVGIISETECLADERFWYDEKNSTISICKMESPIATIMRIAKYAKKGYRINVPEVISILKEWDDRGPEYRTKIYKALERLNNPTSYSYYYRGRNLHVSTQDKEVNVKDSSIFDDVQEVSKEGHNLIDLGLNYDNEDLYSLIRY